MSADTRVMTALSRRIPLTLLCDLADACGPESRRIYDSEQGDSPWVAALLAAEDRPSGDFSSQGAR